MEKKDASLIKLKFFNVLCSILLLTAISFLLFSTYKVISATAVVLIVVSVSTPVVLVGGSFLDMLTGVIEAVLQGVMAIFEGIATVIGSIFS